MVLHPRTPPFTNRTASRLLAHIHVAASRSAGSEVGDSPTPSRQDLRNAVFAAMAVGAEEMIELDDRWDSHEGPADGPRRSPIAPTERQSHTSQREPQPACRTESFPDQASTPESGAAAF